VKKLIVALLLLAACTDQGEARYRLAQVERGPIEAVVVASGTVNAVSSVPVRAPVAGQITEILADFNTPVKAGTVIARLAPTRADREPIVILAPIDGTVILRNAEVGQNVAAGAQAPALFTVARDLREVQVEAALDQADLARLKSGMDASFSVDALPRRRFSGEVRQVGKTVLIAAPNPDQALLPGMTAKLRIVLERRESVLKVPNAALDQSNVWVLEAGKPKAVAVRVGITDGVSSELVRSPLAEGAAVIVGQSGQPRGQ